MHASITDAYDLELHWDNGGSRRITFIPVSDCEFEVKVDLRLTEGLNYQTPTIVTFSTTCYARALWDFRDGLAALQQGSACSAQYFGSEDMELAVAAEKEQAEIGTREALICTLVYEPFQMLEGIPLPARLRIPLGGVGDLAGTVHTMDEFIGTLEMRPDDWS